MAAVRAGVGREAAHEAIKEHAVAVALAMRAGRRQRPDRPARRRCASRARPLAIDDAIAKPLDFVGRPPARSHAFVALVEWHVAQDPVAAAYRPGDIL